MGKIKDITEAKHTLSLDQLPQHNTMYYVSPLQVVVEELQKQTKLLEELVKDLCPLREER